MSVTKPTIIRAPLDQATRITVHNATGTKLDQGSVVNLTGTETGGVPNVEKTVALDDRAIGVLYEDIEDGGDGVCVVGQEIVDVIVNADVTQGEYAGLSTVAGRVENLDVSAPGTGATKIRTIIGIFIGGAGTQSAGDKVKMLILHGIYVNTGT